jgi:hypothetical protein
MPRLPSQRLPSEMAVDGRGAGLPETLPAWLPVRRCRPLGFLSERHTRAVSSFFRFDSIPCLQAT